MRQDAPKGPERSAAGRDTEQDPPRAPAPVRVGLVTLGCPKNTVDSEEMLRGLARTRGVEVVAEAKEAEVVVLNTCAFIGPAKEESVERILEAVRRKEDGWHRGVVVVGCLSERYRRELRQEIPEVDALLGVAPGEAVARTCVEVASRNRDLPYAPPLPSPGEGAGDRACHQPGDDPATRLTPRHTAYLKISEGCDNPCTFCAIPSFRGAHRSKRPEAVLAEARAMAERGVVEINVIAQDTTSYGHDLAGAPRLHELLPAIAATPGIAWTRLLYAYPRFVTNALLEAIASTPGICPYVDMPIQHASEGVLRRMGRGMGRAALTDLIHRMRDSVEGLVLRTTILVGFPGETDEEFEDLLGFLKETRFERLGAFCYSHEEGTPAYRFRDSVPAEVKEERFHRVMEMQREIAFQANEALVGKTVEVLPEEPDPTRKGGWIGRTSGDAPEIDGSIFLTGEGLAPGIVSRARVTRAIGYDLEGVAKGGAAGGSGGVR